MNIFISYSSKSRAVVEVLATDLEALGHLVWFDSKLVGGQDWWAEIVHNIKRCHLFIFALTPEAISSVPCKSEYEYATALNRRVLPIMLADINIPSLPFSLQKLQIIDYRLQNKQQALHLGRTLNNLPPSKALPKPLPTPPPAPIHPLTRLRDQIDVPSLTGDEQRIIVAKLQEFLGDPDTAADAKMLLWRLRERDDLLARTAREIAGLLDIKRHTRLLNELADTTVTSGLLPFRTFEGHAEAVFSVAYSIDGHTILTGSVDGTIRLWDITSGECLQQFTGHSSAVWNAAYSPDGRFIVSTSRDKSVRLWDIATGRQITEITGHSDAVWGVDFSPDGHYILTGSFDKTARLWDVRTGRELLCFKGHSAAVWGVDCSPDGRTAITASWDRTVRIWNIDTGEEMRVLNGFSSNVINVAYSPDGHYILTSERDAPAQLWDAKTGSVVHCFEGHHAFAIAYSPDGKTVLTGGADKTARLWNVKTGAEICQLAHHTDSVTSVAFSSNGSRVLTGSVDHLARLWNLF